MFTSSFAGGDDVKVGSSNDEKNFKDQSYEIKLKKLVNINSLYSAALRNFAKLLLQILSYTSVEEERRCPVICSSCTQYANLLDARGASA